MVVSDPHQASLRFSTLACIAYPWFGRDCDCLAEVIVFFTSLTLLCSSNVGVNELEGKAFLKTL